MQISTTFSTLILHWMVKYVWIYGIIILDQAGIFKFDGSGFQIFVVCVDFLGFWRFH